MFRCLSLILLTCAGVWAQSTKAEVLGEVRDPAGRAVVAAHIELSNLATGLSLSQLSRSDGTFQFLGLPSGEYRVQVQKENFTPLDRSGIVLRIGDRVSLELNLNLGSTNQAMEVDAAPPLLQANRGTVSFVVEQKKVLALPLDGRNFVPLVALAPGVSLPPGSLLPRINGSRPRVSEYIYDGISVLQPEPGQVAFYPVIDAIEEFRIDTNSYSAEYGRSNGGVVMVNLKSGSNDLHGSLFEFFRNEKLNARNLFASTGAKPRFRRNQYGFVLGGPLQKNKTFFFTDWQGTRFNSGVVRLSTVPTASQRLGVFSNPVFDRTIPFAGNTIPASRFDRAALAVVSRYPVPNVAGATANNYRRVGNDHTAADQFDGRLDRYFGERHRVFGRYSFLRDNSKPATPLPDGSGNLTSGVIGDTLTRADSVVAEHTWSLSANAVNQLRVGFTGRRFERASMRLAEPAQTVTLIPNLPVSSFANVLPTYDVVGFQQLGAPPSGNSNFTTSVSQLVDNYSWVGRGHSLKLGVDLRWQNLDVLQPPSPTGNFQFTSIFTSDGAAGSGNSFASFLLGQVSRFSIDAQQEVLRPRAKIAELFLQDDWRLSRRLTVNLGVRYTLNFPSTVVGDKGAVFDLNSQKLNFLGADGGSRAARDLEKKNFAPRLGIAYKLRESLVVRAGFGLTWIEQAGITTPFTTPLFPFIQTLGQQTPDNINPAFMLSQGPSVRLVPPGPDAGLGQGVFGVQRTNGSGYAQQWNLSLQKTLGLNWSFEAGYLGSKLTRLGVPDVNLNQLTVEQLALGEKLTEQVAGIPRAQLLRPYPQFTTVALYRNNVGHSTYHSFQSRIEKRLSHGLTFTLAYTFSKLIDDAGAVFDSAVQTGPVSNFQAADSFNKRLEKDVSTGNMEQVLSSGFVYQIPFWGWQIAGLLRAQSGSPIAVTQATNLNAFAGFGVQRPNRLKDSTLNADQRSTTRWFNTEAFAQTGQFRIGNSSRNPALGPGYRTLDLMLGKTIRLLEKLRMELRVEAFNVTNTPPLGNPNGSFGNVGFGSITTALDPRVFELVVKIHF